MKRILAALLLLALLLPMNSCMTFQHTVGRGPAGGAIEKASAWYALWGLVPIDVPDSKKLAGPAVNYRVTTQYTVVDVIITMFTGFLTIHKQTISVEK